MSRKNLKSKDFKIGFSNIQKKGGLNFWRFFFVGINEVSREEETFFLEIESVNPSLSPSQIVSGLSVENISAENLQAALTGFNSSFDSSKSKKPSYYVVRIAKLGQHPKQLCQLFSASEVNFNQRDFEIRIGNKIFSENKLCGFISVTKDDLEKKSALFCNEGYATWSLEYKICETQKKGFKNDRIRWFPFGIKSDFAGKVSFDGEDYIVNPKKSSGYVGRFFGNTFLEKWIHVHCSDFVSLISGRRLENSSFCIQGVFNDKVSFVGNLEEIEISFFADKSKRSYNCVFDCNQMPGIEEKSEQLLHWTFSINNKNWIIDAEVFCKIRDLYDRILESCEGGKKILNILEGGNGYGEIKLYKQKGKSIEQIEHAKLNNVVCEFGNSDIFGDIENKK